MRGRTNVGGGGSFFVDGNTVVGISDERNGLVSGDFVEKVITKKELISSSTYRDNGISDNFSLGAGKFCTFFLSGGINIWLYKIENDEMVDSGTMNLEIPVEEGTNKGYEQISAVQISESEFIVSCVSVIDTVDFHTYFKIIITNDNATISYLGKNNVDFTSSFLYFGKLESNKFVMAYRKRETSSITYPGVYLYVVNLVENAVSFGETYSSTQGIYLGISIYEDSHIVIFQDKTAHFLKIIGNEITTLKDYTLISQPQSAVYIGENRTLLIWRAQGSYSAYPIYGCILTMTETVTIISEQKKLTNAISDLWIVSAHNTNGEIFIGGIATTAGSSSTTIKYYIGMWNPSSENPIELTFIYSIIVYVSSYRPYISGVCAYSGNLVVSPSISIDYENFRKPIQIGCRYSDYGIEPFEEIVKFRKRVSRIDGVAKQSAAYEEPVEVYVPKS